MKNKKIIYVLVLAVVLCFVSAFGVYAILTPQRATVYVFRADCTTGTQITKDLLMPVEIDATIVEMGQATPVNQQYVTEENYNEVLKNASTLRWDITKGTTLTKSMLTTYGGSKVEMQMKPSAIAVTVPTDYLSAVTNEISSGARVNVYASYDNAGAQTMLILQNIRVLTAPKTADGMVVGVTLEVDHKQSLQLIHAISYAKIYLGLVDENGYQYTVEDQPTYDVTGFQVGADTASNPQEPVKQPENTTPPADVPNEPAPPANDTPAPPAE